MNIDVKEIIDSNRFAVEFDERLIEIGDWQTLQVFAAALHELVEFAEPDFAETVARNDERFVEWITIGDAAQIAIEEFGWPSTSTNGDTIRGAARRENFRTQKDASGRYQINRASFVQWLHDRQPEDEVA